MQMHLCSLKCKGRVKTEFRMVNGEIQSQLSYNQIIAPIGLNFIYLRSYGKTQNDSVRLLAWQIVHWFQCKNIHILDIIYSDQIKKLRTITVKYFIYFSIHIFLVTTNIRKVSHFLSPNVQENPLIVKL